MCGIAGIFENKMTSRDLLSRRALAMRDQLIHRGPDAGGLWEHPTLPLVLTHRRLSILDLSENGAQPKRSTSGRFVLTFNGEIYNHQELRAELLQQDASLSFSGHSDTETLLTGFELWGITETLKKSRGMFALAVWDQRDQTLSLWRDRVGEKPLIYGYFSGNFGFASEVRAFEIHPEFERKENPKAVEYFLGTGAIPGTLCIYQGLQKLKPAHGIIFTLRDLQNQHIPQEIPYDPEFLFGTPKLTTLPEKELVSSLDRLLLDSVAEQSLADVSLGCFLSGGIDSSLIAGLLTQTSPSRPKTFSIGFHEAEFNEAPFAKAVADHLGTEHTELMVSAQDALDLVPKLGEIFDEPFADSSQIPTVLLSRLTRKHVTVSLSGDAGDELFGGYTRYRLVPSLYQSIKRVPLTVRSVAQKTLNTLPDSVISLLAESANALLPRSQRISQPQIKLQKFLKILSASDLKHTYQHLITQWEHPGRALLNPANLVPVGLDPCYWTHSSPLRNMMTADFHTYLPDDILVKVDRSAMHSSLETRAPFLDQRVIQFSRTLPNSLLIRQGQGKFLLRQVLKKYVPNHLVDRPKTGFGIPIDRWLKQELKAWGSDLLSKKSLQGYLDLNAPWIQKQWEQHQSGTHAHGYGLWNILMLLSWRDSRKNIKVTS